MPRRRKTEGDGLLVDIASKITGSRPGEKALKKLVHDHGNAVIQSIQIGRTPVEEKTNKLMNLISAGKFQQAKEQYDFDKLFHLFLVIKGSDGFTFSLEKVPYPTVGSPKIRPNTEMVNVPLQGKKITVGEFIQNGINTMGSSMYTYDWRKENCQHFCENMLKASGLLTSNAEKFIQQRMEQTLAKEFPSFSSQISTFATDLSGVLHRLKGNGLLPASWKGKSNIHDLSDGIRAPRPARTSTIPLKHLFSQEGKGLWDFAMNIGKQAVKEGIKSGVVEGSKAAGSHFGKAAGDRAARRIVGSGLCGPLKTHKDEDYDSPIKVKLTLSQEAKLRGVDPTTPVLLQLKPSQKSGNDVLYLTKVDRLRLERQWRAGKSSRVYVLA